jgi:pimeloyl-ACP methyl ester carboxylesterase
VVTLGNRGGYVLATLLRPSCNPLPFAYRCFRMTGTQTAPNTIITTGESESDTRDPALVCLIVRKHGWQCKYAVPRRYGNLRDYGLADKKAILEQLGDRHSFIDLDRIGIYGHSGGGFMSTAAMLVYPDFFKVAVSSSGNHENDVYNRSWSETHDGIKEIEVCSIPNRPI